MKTAFAARLWTYQAERFPLLKHGLLIAVFALAAVAYASLLGASPGWPNLAVAAVVSLLLFFQLRVADEHKDFEDDARWRPERPVPRGLVTLAELRGLALAAAVIQAVAVALLDLRLLLWLGVVWAWLALMTAEFFAPAWLKARPVLYLLSHMAIMPLIALFALACGGGGALAWSLGVVAFMALSFFDGIVLEVGRKAWAPENEREGVETYSKLWSPRGAAMVLALAALGSAASSVTAQAAIDAPRALWSLPLLAAAVLLAVAFAYARSPTPGSAGRLETTAGVWTLVGYLAVGFLPYLRRAWLT